MPTWSGIRKKLENEYLADSLKGRVSYFATSYSRAPDHIGRAAIKLDGEEVFKSDYFKLSQFQWKAYQNKLNYDKSNISQAWSESWGEAINNGGFDNHCFYEAFNEYDNQSIEASLESNNALVRTFAVLDRRVGKRRLKELSGIWIDEQDWVVFFLKVRLKAEGISE